MPLPSCLASCQLCLPSIVVLQKAVVPIRTLLNSPLHISRENRTERLAEVLPAKPHWPSSKIYI
ncbi:hypothetical protein SERLA73DRAFT_131832 [Serpula lacrymans var. lacrymans S7.3]|uniref:Uncharacterized protein n=2 Tax=Serpula lacrymans var. lacrymans TaxID=341189 RepID=F8PQ56_SERL3|nr:uncharacterized protein SERLADRAFT_381492 [Serpula lacrymans var. lacrymans S7.9]EGO01521.1 hypothetical protein SERLA73DRAFT_131832 [Serpula lacrymans var. lacrymans S7.3]EGO27175.1 hypothetical protein SERLADRAFT_381492 [Serpula lacrymans var. lacrymans S7.9]